MERLLLGVDGGGSKTLALAADGAGRVLGRGVAGPSNCQVVGVEAACAALDAATGAALASVPGGCLAAICLGLAGAGRPPDQAAIRAWAEARYPGVPVTVVHDARLALAAGTPAGWGIAVISGTGSLVYGADGSGNTARAGGWGYLLGDEGSAYAVGLAALRAVARAADGRAPETTLAEALLSHWNLDRPQDLIRRVYQTALPRAEIACLAVLVESAARSGDGTARAILQSAGRELALAVQAVVCKLELPGPIPCALAGSLLVKGEAVAAAFCRSVAEFGLELAPITPVDEPARGAIRLAKELYEQGQLDKPDRGGE